MENKNNISYDYVLINDANTLEDLTVKIHFCVNCNNQFTPKKNSRPGIASYYRCSECLNQSIIKNIFYYCTIS